jgi:hypothetical protein
LPDRKKNAALVAAVVTAISAAVLAVDMAEADLAAVAERVAADLARAAANGDTRQLQSRRSFLRDFFIFQSK